MVTASSDRDALAGLALTMQAAPGRFALLVGSGISRSSGIPTGWDVVNDLAARLAVAEGADEPPVDPIAWYVDRFDGKQPDYSALLEAIAPTAAQRRDLLAGYFEPTDEEREEGLKAPTAAHHAIARLVAGGYVRVIVTTNFDRLLEQALQAAGIEPVVVASASAAAGTIPLAHTRCTVIKVHGDYLDPNVKNTVAELESYDPAFDRMLDQVFDEYGLVVCGWSGDWDRALRNAIERCPTRRYGTYWAHRSDMSEHAQRIVSAREAVPVPITSADGFFDTLANRIAALNELARRNVGGVDAVVADAKRFLPDPIARIKLRDLAMDTVDTALRAIDFDVNPPRLTNEAYLDVVRTIENSCAPLVGATTVLAQFAEHREHVDLINRVLTQCASPTNVVLGGTTALIDLRGYPTMLAIYATGLGACAEANWAPLIGATSLQATNRYTGTRVEFPVLYSSWHVLEPTAVQSQFQARQKTPLSDHLHDYFGTVLKQVLRIGDQQFDDLFDEWEYLLGVLIAGLAGHGPVGRFAWRRHSRDRAPDAALRAAGPSLLDAGLFSGDKANLEAIENEYNKVIRQSGNFW